MNGRNATLSALLAAAVVLGLAAAVAHATAPGKNGRIAFVRYRLSDNPVWAEIWVINPDGSRERQVSYAPRGYVDLAPDWAPTARASSSSAARRTTVVARSGR